MNISDYSCKFFKANDILNSFLTEVRKYSVPSLQEEEALIDRYKNGDETAKDELIIRNLRFVYSLAKIYARGENEVVDYVNEGVIGLMMALDDFDPTKGYKFITYGVWYIRRQMNYYMLTKRDMVSHSAQVGNVNKKSDIIRQKHFAEFGELPSDEEVAKILFETYNIKVSKMEDLHETDISSIDDNVSEDYKVEETNEYNVRTASYNDYENVVDEEYSSALVNAYLEALPEKAKKIVCLRFGINEDRAYSSEEISDMLNIAPERIDKICEAALLEMRSVNVAKKVM